MMMIGKVMIVTILIAISPVLIAQTCYQVYNKDQKLIWAKTKPPFDISGPPFHVEYEASRVRGERLLVTRTNECYLPEELEAKQAKISAKIEAERAEQEAFLYRRAMRKQQERTEQLNRYKEELNECEAMGLHCTITAPLKR